MVFIYEIPFFRKHALEPATWKSDSQLCIVDERTMQETIITVPTSAVAKNAVIAKPVVIDKYVKQGANKLRVQSIGERFCLKRLGPRKRGKRFKDEGSQRKGRLHHADAGLVGCVSSSSDLG